MTEDSWLIVLFIDQISLVEKRVKPVQEVIEVQKVIEKQ